MYSKRGCTCQPLCLRLSAAEPVVWKTYAVANMRQPPLSHNVPNPALARAEPDTTTPTTKVGSPVALCLKDGPLPGQLPGSNSLVNHNVRGVNAEELGQLTPPNVAVNPIGHTTHRRGGRCPKTFSGDRGKIALPPPSRALPVAIHPPSFTLSPTSSPEPSHNLSFHRAVGFLPTHLID